jgi:hypothetical protein
LYTHDKATNKTFSCIGTISSIAQNGPFEYEINYRFEIPHIPTMVHLMIPNARSTNIPMNENVGKYGLKSLTNCKDLQDNTNVQLLYEASPYFEVETLTGVRMIGVKVLDSRQAEKLRRPGLSLITWKIVWILQLAIVLRLLYIRFLK